jgi:ribosomal protein L11 methylase PrmA
VWDLGANTGVFSRLTPPDTKVIAFDIDPVAVEANYLKCRDEGERNILPLLLDLTNPSPAIGWDNRERLSLSERVGADTILALALVHHLAISNNLPLEMIARWLALLGKYAIIEFVPKSDSQVQRLLASREDIFPNYTTEGFESAITSRFNIVKKCPIRETERTIYLLERKSGS